MLPPLIWIPDAKKFVLFGGFAAMAVAMAW
jgi:hypothetical protein